MCKKSESIKEIAIALAKFNAKVQRIEKDSTNPHFKNKYASLDGIMDEVRPMLAEEGLSVLQMPSGLDGKLKLTTMLIHTSGEWIESAPIEMQPAKNDPQGIGSATTYARRYSLCAFLGLSTGDLDDDGNSASIAPQSQQSAPRTYTPSPPSQPVQSTPTVGTALITDAQVKMVQRLKNEKKLMDEQYRAMLQSYGVESTKDLSKQAASKIIERLTSYVPEPVTAPSEDDLPF